MKAKQFKKISAVFALSLTLAGTAASVCLPLLSVQAEGKNIIKGTQVKALTTEQQVLDAVKAAKAAGVTVNEKGRATKTVASKDYDATKKVVSDGYAQQIKTLNERTTKQKAQDAKYQKELADWNAKYNNSNDASDVVDPNTLIQKLVLNAEPDAKMNVKNFNPNKVTGRELSKGTVDSKYSAVYSGNGLSHKDQVLGAYEMASKDGNAVTGDLGEVTYTNLKHSEYDGKKITKIVITYSNLKAGASNQKINDGRPSALAAADPTVTLSYFNSDGVTYTPKYYTEDGKQVDFSQRYAYLSFGSLNSNGNVIEKAQVIDGGKAIGFSGSSVTAHKNGWLYSDKSNEYADIPEKFKGWDDEKSPEAAYGAGLVDIKTNKLAINYAANGKVYVWARASTTIPQSIVPPKPVKPAPLKADYQFTDIKVTSDKPIKTADKEGNLVLTGDVITQHISQNTGIGNDNTKYWIGDAIFYGKDGKLPVKYSLKDFTITNSKGKDVSGLFKLTESEGTVTNKKARLIKATPIDGKKLADDTYTLNAKETAIGDIAADKITDVGISMAGNTGEHYYPQLDPKAQKHWTDGDKSTDGKKYMAGELADATVSTDYPDQSKLADKITKLGLIDDYSNFAKYVEYKSSKVFEGTKDVTSEYTITNKDNKVMALRKDPTKATAGKAKLVTTFKIKDNVPNGTTFTNAGSFILNGITTPTTKPKIETYDPKAIKDVEAGTVKGETDATIDKKEVKKGDKLTYILGSNDLPANRKDDIKSHVSKDTLPKEVEYNGFKAYLPDGKGGFTDVTKDVTLKADTTKHNLEFTEGKALLDGYNKDKTKATKTVIIDVYVTAKQDGSAFNNTYTLLTNGHADTSNKVENRTPNAKQPEKPSKPETPNKPETPSKPELPQTGSAVGKTTLWDFIKNLF